jgi:transcription-repair coupling factor (superfamily II helicase)
MTREDVLALYLKHPATLRGAEILLPERSRLYLKGLVGSGRALIMAGIIQKMGGVHVIVMNDREEAAYLMNDLQNLRPDYPEPLFFPVSHRVPYQAEEVENANISMRAEVLNAINKGGVEVVVLTYPEALAERVLTRKELSRHTFDIRTGDRHSMDFVDELLIEYGFEKTDYVYRPGQFSVRGGIIDVFSYSADHPFRIEYFGDEIESIRKFDPGTQLSVVKMERATIIPNIGEKLMREAHETFLDFLPPSAVLWFRDFQLCRDQVEKELGKAMRCWEKLESPLGHLRPEELYSEPELFVKQASVFRIAETGSQAIFSNSQKMEFSMAPQPSFHKNFELLTENLRENAKAGFHNVLVAGNPRQIERLYSIFEDKDHEVLFKPLVMELSEGFIDRDTRFACYTDHQIFDRYHRFRLKEGFRKNSEALTLKELSGLQPGDFVVHIDHGVGVFSGLQKIDVNGKEQEAIRLTYRDGDTLYVSIHSLHRISKYTGKEGTAPSINKLGSAAWGNLKSRTKKRIKEIAFDLIQLYAKRKATKGFEFSPDTYLQTELEASFMYEDTPDQFKATQEVKADMESSAPMDRLVCGDVGFGKTEVAIRAAFKAVADGKQVAVLAPTTILSLQHYRNFRDRLADFPCRVDYLNRFKSAKQSAETLKDLESGKVDIIIGTHALVGKKVKFKDLGLLIVDEEQKFGVAVKDKLKTLKENVDTLTMTATPIPRTLQFSLMSARDMSVIATPPPNRFPIQTELRPFNEEVIRDAVQYEVSRGGQVFFVHNRVANIREVAGMIQRLCPDVRIGVGHGQMDGEKLEEVMTTFIEGGFDVLVCTTIVESGIDIPNANTIIINDAHNFGLSDLHQLRGRVGRSNKKAFCYLLSPPVSLLTSDARKRLQAIEQFSDLGSGIHIAMRDLDIRGAGDLLGAEQSGFIADIGFEMYHKILNEAVQELKENEFREVFAEELKKGKEFVQDTTIETDFELLIPDHYVSSTSERLNLYRELDETGSENALAEFKERLVDRFGPVPEETEDLFHTIRLRWLSKAIGFEKLILKGGKMIGHFIAKQDSPYYDSPAFSKVLSYVKDNARSCKMYEKDGVLRLSFPDVSSISQAISRLKPLSLVQVGEEIQVKN